MKRMIQSSNTPNSLEVVLRNKGLTNEEIDDVVTSVQEMIDDALREFEDRIHADIWEAINRNDGYYGYEE